MHHHGRRAEREDDRLPGVEHRERDVGRDAQLLVARHRLVVAGRLALLGAEILDGLEVEEAVDRLGIGVLSLSFIDRRIAIRQLCRHGREAEIGHRS